MASERNEKTWKEQLESMRGLLIASERGEAGLQMQLASLARQTEAMSFQIGQLKEDKAALLHRISTTEQKPCEKCSRRGASPSPPQRPVPAPRHFKVVI